MDTENEHVATISDYRASHVGRLLLQAHRDFSNRAIDQLRAAGYRRLGVAHIAVLPHLSNRGARVTDLAAQAGMTKQGMGQLIRELEDQGFVERVPDPADARAALVQFTSVGRELLSNAVAITQAIEREYRAVLGTDRLEDLKHALADLIRNDRPNDVRARIDGESSSGSVI